MKKKVAYLDRFGPYIVHDKRVDGRDYMQDDLAMNGVVTRIKKRILNDYFLVQVLFKGYDYEETLPFDLLYKYHPIALITFMETKCNFTDLPKKVM